MCHVTSLLVGKTRDWLIEDRQLSRSFVILKHANAQYSAHPQPHYRQRRSVHERRTGIAVDVNCEERSSDLPGR